MNWALSASRQEFDKTGSKSAKNQSTKSFGKPKEQTLNEALEKDKEKQFRRKKQ